LNSMILIADSKHTKKMSSKIYPRLFSRSKCH
jgi:hypothetical protein